MLSSLPCAFGGMGGLCPQCSGEMDGRSHGSSGSVLKGPPAPVSSTVPGGCSSLLRGSTQVGGSGEQPLPFLRLSPHLPCGYILEVCFP